MTINFNPFPALSSARLSFRQLVNEDDRELLKLRSDERVNRYITRSPCQSLAEARAFVGKINKAISAGDSIYWAISLQGDDKLIGTICIWNLQPENHRAEIGYELSPDYWKQGIMTEAVPVIIDYGFNTMKLHSLEASVDPDNLPSARLLEKNGFELEGRFRESIFFNNRFSDRAVYSLVK